MKTGPVIVPLSQAIDPALVGGKAINLAKMLEAGLPVPDGFVVTTVAFNACRETPVMPETVAEQIRSAYAGMGSPLVAVRSSATAEDMAEASMAGQYESYLNVSSAHDVIEAVNKCWRSLRGVRVTAYLLEHGIRPDEVAMAVVVQRLVAAEVAGVLFTANPQTGDLGEMVVEAAWGLGESVVSGQVQPDIVRIGREECDILEYRVGEKASLIAPGEQAAREVDPDRRSKACLNYRQIHRLWSLGRQVCEYFGRPQDVEWALAGDQVFLVQSRAITTLDDARRYHDLLHEMRRDLRRRQAEGDGPWVRHNLGETLPHPTPLTWSIIRQFMSGKGGFGRMYRMVGFEPSPVAEEQGILTLIGGQVYMDCSRMPGMFSDGFPFAYDVSLLRRQPDAAQQPPTVPTGTWRQQTAAARLCATVMSRLRDLARDLDRRFDEEFVPGLLEWCRQERSRDLSQLADEALIALWNGQQSKVMDEFGAMAFLPSMIEAQGAAELRAFLDEHSWDEDPDVLLATLMHSPTPDKTMQANAELQEVALGKRTIDRWLQDHGHRAPAEFDLATPRWSERPAEVEPLVQPLKQGACLTKMHEQRHEQTQACLERLRKSLPAGQREELDRLAGNVRRYCRFREDGKYYLMWAYNVLRITALEFGRRLGIGEGVFFLTPDEIFQALRSGFVPEDRMERRRKDHKAQNRLRLPHVIDIEEIDTLGESALPAGTGQWKGHPLSCGVCTGPARIVHDPTAATELGTGYVLVCPSTDPSWTPLFVHAAGLILERGGSLSHGAVVAREMGLPAIVLDGATSLLRDGQVLVVNGNTGAIAPAGSLVDAPNAGDDVRVERSLIPPIVSAKERRAATLGLAAALIWTVFLAAAYVLPAEILREPAFRLIDAIVWPLIPRVGMVWTVAIIAGVFGLLPILGQKLLTDNRRLYEAKRRADLLGRLAARLPQDAPRRQALRTLAAGVTTRTLKAAMVPLMLILGPMIMVFMWLPDRVDPAAWTAEPGRTVTILAELDGKLQTPVTLEVPAPISLDSTSPATQTLPPIRQELEALRAEWSTGSDTSAYPWELQAAADEVRQAMLASLNAYLQAGVPPQTLSWIVRIPPDADGHYPIRLVIDADPPYPLNLAFHRRRPPAPAEVTSENASVRSLKAVYPRPLQQRRFWAPLSAFGGPAWDFGWLAVYILAYLLVMFPAKLLLRVP
jgi:pyruvate,water dikinase